MLRFSISMFRDSRRSRIPASYRWLLPLALIVCLGCEQTKVASIDDTGAESAVISSATQVESANAKNPPQATEISPDSVNEDGLVVLTGPEDALGDVAAEILVQQSTDSGKTSAPISLASSTEGRQLPAEANVVRTSELNQVLAQDWPEPQAVLFVSGQQHGYIEPCGCTGLDKQKGGLIRRDTLLRELRSKGWDVIPLDVGNQVRRFVRQAELKFATTVDALKMMDYEAVAFGPDDLQLSSVELIQLAGSEPGQPGMFLSTNVSVIDSSFFPQYRIKEVGGRKIGITTALGAEYKKGLPATGDFVFSDPVETVAPIVKKMQADGCDFVVLLAHASLEESAKMGQEIPGIDLVVTAGGVGEPTLLPESIEGSDAVMVQVGTKGMYGGIVGLFDDEEYPIRYQKIAISAQFKDSPRMLERFAEYQGRLKEVGFAGLGAQQVVNQAGEYVGSETCGECHTTAFEIWENSPHVHATDSLIAANNDRGGIARHFDPECVSCHATGWNVTEYYPYETGFVSPEATAHLTGSGCENCHGPGKDHVEAEYGDVEVSNEELEKLRQKMIIPLDKVRQQKCINCHDLDNSPDFQEKGAFEEYWEQVKHYGKD
ncbi:MAG: multiheme c-type cytochrome [Pirellulaceae bacterium]